MRTSFGNVRARRLGNALIDKSPIYLGAIAWEDPASMGEIADSSFHSRACQVIRHLIYRRQGWSENQPDVLPCRPSHKNRPSYKNTQSNPNSLRLSRAGTSVGSCPGLRSCSTLAARKGSLRLIFAVRTTLPHFRFLGDHCRSRSMAWKHVPPGRQAAPSFWNQRAAFISLLSFSIILAGVFLGVLTPHAKPRLVPGNKITHGRDVRQRQRARRGGDRQARSHGP